MNFLQSVVTLVDGVGGFYIGIGLILLGMGFSSIAEGLVCAAALKGMSRNPEATSKLRSSMILGVSLCETVAIYGLVLAILLIFVKNHGSF